MNSITLLLTLFIDRSAAEASPNKLVTQAEYIIIL